jgi:hypothetical protein
VDIQRPRSVAASGSGGATESGARSAARCVESAPVEASRSGLPRSCPLASPPPPREASLCAWTAGRRLPRQTPHRARPCWCVLVRTDSGDGVLGGRWVVLVVSVAVC